jgi:hypothetical protein
MTECTTPDGGEVIDNQMNKLSSTMIILISTHEIESVHNVIIIVDNDNNRKLFNLKIAQKITVGNCSMSCKLLQIL